RASAPWRAVRDLAARGPCRGERRGSVDPRERAAVPSPQHRRLRRNGRAIRRALADPAWHDGTPYYLPPLSLPYLVATLPVRLRTALLVRDVRPDVVERARCLATPAATDTDLATALLVAVRSGAGERSCERIARLLLEREDGTGGWCGSAFFRGLG
ncbi:MAG: hypothetical protein KY467_15270, partial [Gemmatimonadetes bacterium]|nr:hypothetical protein [Gemmatimonadota bacterium]